MEDPTKKAPEMAPPPYPGPQPGFVAPPAMPMQPGYPPQAGAPGYPPQAGAPGYPPQAAAPGYPVQPGAPPPMAPTYPAYPPTAPGPQQPYNSGNYYYNYGSVETPQNQGIIRGGYDSDVEGGQWEGGPNNSDLNAFSDKAVRMGFIRKVYGLLMVQLTITGLMIAAFTFIEPVREYARRSQWLYWVAFAVLMVCMIAMACCEGVRRKSPTNYIFLGIFTLAQGFMLGTVTAHFSATSVLIAVGICAAVTLALTLFAFQTKYDFTTCGGMLCAMIVVLFVAGIIVAIWPSKLAIIGYGVAGALIFSMYIVYDTQLMMGGKHKYALDPEEYVFAALNLYLDIINLFLYILMIVGASRGE